MPDKFSVRAAVSLNADTKRWTAAQVRRVIKSWTRLIADEMRKLVSTPYPPASAPGQPPHARTYGLHDSITDVYDEAGQVGYVNVGAPYAGALDGGTKHMAARPFTAKAIARALAKARGIIGVKRQE